MSIFLTTSSSFPDSPVVDLAQVQMESINPQINALHASYCSAMQIDLPMNLLFERYWFDALESGVTVKMVADVVIDRLKRIKAGVRYPESLKLRNLIGDESALGDLLNEAAVVASRARLKVVEPGKASVLKASGRPEWYLQREQAVSPQEQNSAKPVSELISELRKAAGM